MTTSSLFCNPDKFKAYTNEALNVFYPVISIESDNNAHDVRILLKDYSQLETLIAILKDHYEDFIARESESART